MQLSLSAQNLRSAALEALFNHLLSPFFSLYIAYFPQLIFSFFRVVFCIVLKRGQKYVYHTKTFR